MGGLGIWLRAEARRRWRAWLAVAVIAGVGWGAVMVAAAGARRTDTAFDRFREVFKGRDILASPFGDGREFSKAVEKLPEVASAGRIIGLNAFVVDPKPPPDFAFGAPLIALDDKLGRTIDRPKLLRGRVPRLDAADEALVSPTFVKPLHIGVGDWVTLQPITSGDPGSGTQPVLGPTFRVRIVGIGVTQAEAFPISTFDRLQPLMLMSPAAYVAHWKQSYAAFDGVVMRLQPGTDVGALEDHLKQVQKRYPESGEDIFFAAETDRPPIVRRAFRPQVAALLAFAAALGLTLILVVSQSVARQISIHATVYPTLRAIGMSPRRMLAAAVAPAAAAALAASAIAIVVAIIASPLTPIGSARLAEPHPGIAMDAVVLGIGSVMVLLWFTAAALIASRRVGRAAPDDAAVPVRTSRLAHGLAGTGVPVPTTTGVRMALESGRGATAVPVRTVILSAMVSVVALTAAYTFGASLDRAVQTPRLFGQRWNATVDAQFDAVFPDRLGYKDDPAYEAVAGGLYASRQIRIGDVAVPVIGLEELKGSIFPTLLEGHPPRADDEVVLGTSTLHRVHTKVGSSVVVSVGEEGRRLRVVGRAVLPSFGIGSFTPTDLGEGAIMTPQALGGGFERLSNDGYSFVLVRFAKDASPAAVRRVDRACDDISASGEICLVRHNQRPPEIASYAQVRNLSWLLAGLLAALTAATLAHGLVATVRRRRRDLAVLKTLGFVRRQISAAVAWQATTQVVLALVGIPLGVLAGRWAWIGLADQLGIPAEPRVPLLVIALTIPALVVLGNIVAALPGRAASRTQAALVLRTE